MTIIRKQSLTTLALLCLTYFFATSLYSQRNRGRFYNVSVDGIEENILALNGSLPAPCTMTMTGEMVIGIPADGCNPLTNPNDLTGKIAVLDRGSCNFTEKIKHAQDVGAIAVVICNNRPEAEDGGGVLVMGGEDSEGINLFAVMISQEDCAIFKSNLPLDATFNVTGFEDATADDRVLWGNEPGQGDFDGGLNGWTTNTISCDGKPAELDLWKYDPDGILDEGALSIGESPGPSFCNGMMAFDSDYLDNEGAILNSDGTINTGAVGTGPCPAPQIGELISPIIDISNIEAEGVSLEFYQETRQLNSEYFIQYSLDAGMTYSDLIQINAEIEGNEFNEVNKTTVPLTGAAGASQLRIKFIYSGNYYYWLIDDVKIVAREAHNLKISDDFFAMTPNVKVPKSQVVPINFLANVQNIGGSTQENTMLSIEVIKDNTNEEVFRDIQNIGRVKLDSTIENVLFPNQFIPPAEVAEYTGNYTVFSDSIDYNPSDNIRRINFEVTEGEFANENGLNLINFEITDKEETPTWSIGNYFYLPKGSGFQVSKFGIGIGNASEVSGLEVGIRMFKWTDEDFDSDSSVFPKAVPEERELIAFADYEIRGNEQRGEANIIYEHNIFDSNGKNVPILLDDDAHYLVMLTMDAEVGISAKDDLYTNYLAMNKATISLGLPKYWSFFGNGSDIFTTIYDANTSFTPLVRLYIAPVIPPPQVNFVADTLTVNCAPFTINFTDSTISDASILSWFWGFGDGNTSKLQNPTHTYTDFGTYNVTLSVNDIQGKNDIITKFNYIQINQSITGRDTIICSGQMIDLATLINGTPLNDLEYGTTLGTYGISTIQKPIGTTTYFVRDSNRTTMCVDTAKIIVTVNPQPNIVGRDTAICSGQAVDLTTLINGNLLNGLEIGIVYNNYANTHPIQTPTDTTTYFFRDSVTSTTCADTTLLNIFVEQQPFITGRDTTIMVGQTIDLTTLLNESIIGDYSFSTENGNYELGNPITINAAQIFIIRDSIENEVGCRDTAKVIVNIPSVQISFLDRNGDDQPDITDPCNCFDNENVRASDNGQTKVTLFHDFVTIRNGGIGQTWVLDANNVGAVLQKNDIPFPINTPLNDLGNGVYRLDFWHKPDIGFNATFRRLSDNTIATIGNSCSEQDCIIIPTLSQWGLIIFGLLILNINLIFIRLNDEYISINNTNTKN